MAQASRTTTTQLLLCGARVNSGFRDALLDAANRAGMTANEFCITAAAEKLRRSGADFPGVFHAGDFAGLAA